MPTTAARFTTPAPSPVPGRGVMCVLRKFLATVNKTVADVN